MTPVIPKTFNIKDAATASTLKKETLKLQNFQETLGGLIHIFYKSVFAKISV